MSTLRLITPEPTLAARPSDGVDFAHLQFGWQVTRVADGHALSDAHASFARPHPPSGTMRERVAERLTTLRRVRLHESRFGALQRTIQSRTYLRCSKATTVIAHSREACLQLSSPDRTRLGQFINRGIYGGHDHLFVVQLMALTQ